MTAPTTRSTPRRTRSRTIFGDVARIARRAAGAHTEPFDKYHDDPVAFASEVLGLEPWEGQVRVLRAVLSGDRVTVVSGHGVGKSTSAAAAGLWFWRTRGPRALAILTAPTARQIDEVVWKEVRRLYLGAKVPLGGEIARLARTGLRSEDGRLVIGVTAENAESFAGIRAPEMLIVADEASGIPDFIFTALTGNLAGGGKLLLLGNPTKATGFFFESHKSERFTRLHIPSTASPNVRAERIVIPGLVTTDWVQDRAHEWGADSPLYRMRVLGEFVEAQEGRLFTPDMLAAAERRWHDTKPTGRLVIGLDPAGDSGQGDESAFAIRQGMRVLRIVTRRGLSADGHVVEIAGIVRTFAAGGRERPLVVVDRDGFVGARVFAALAAYQGQHEDLFALTGVRGGERAKRRPKDIDRVRDEVWLALADAFRDGLAIPEDVRLARELAEVRLERHISGRSKVTPKDDLRKALGRSPDRADALALSIWEAPAFDADVGESDHGEVDLAGRDASINPYDYSAIIDPYAGVDRWR